MRKEIEGLIFKNDVKIVLAVVDGLGGLPGEDGPTELEKAVA